MRKRTYQNGRIEVNESYEAVPLETTIARLMASDESIDNVVPPMYTERKAGVLAETNIRTDRFDIAIDAMDKVDKSYKAAREEKLTEVGKPESIAND